MGVLLREKTSDSCCLLSPSYPTYRSGWLRAVIIILVTVSLIVTARYTVLGEEDASIIKNGSLDWVTPFTAPFSTEASDATHSDAESLRPTTTSAEEIAVTTATSTPTTTSQHTDRVAVIIENRPLPNLVPVILHFLSVLGPQWSVILYTTPLTANQLKRSPSFARALRSSRLSIRFLPSVTEEPTAALSSHYDVSLFLTRTWLWENLAPYEKVLMFQTDSVICAGSEVNVDDFLEWDLIGAPIDEAYGTGFNGGLSLRDRELTLKVLRRWSFEEDSSLPSAPAAWLFEDQWFYARINELRTEEAQLDESFESQGEDQGNNGPPSVVTKLNTRPRAIKIPGREMAMKFAVESVWADRPLGYHQPLRWQADHIAEIREWCPEIGMISGAAFFT